MRLFPVLFALLLACCGAFAQEASRPSRAGEVSFVAGRVLLGEGVQARTLKVGDTVQAGDLLQTGAGGHLHIKTIDGGFLALRPSSRARVDVFEFDPAQPAETRIRLVLESGVMRAVSGVGAQAARDKFRLNTPVAAIGIRGTDFTVSTTDAVTRVAVQKGEIVLAPFDEACRADALGPCTGSSMRALSAEQVGRLLELHRGQAEPRLIEVRAGSAAPDQVSPPASSEPRASTTSTPSNGGASGSGNVSAAAPAAPGVAAAPAVAATVGTANSAPPATVAIVLSAPMVGAPSAAHSPAPAAVLVSEAHTTTLVQNVVKEAAAAPAPVVPPPLTETPPAQPPVVEIPPAQPPVVEIPPAQPPLVEIPVPPVVIQPPAPVITWGRWAAIANQPDSVNFDAFVSQFGPMAAINKLYVISVSNAENLRMPETGNFSFTLTGGEAWTVDKGVVSGAATVLAGQLSVNFGAQRFSTRLDVDAMGTLGTLSAQGRLTISGLLSGDLIFSRPDVTMNVRGALGGEQATSATYVFDGALTSTRSVVGVVDWKR